MKAEYLDIGGTRSFVLEEGQGRGVLCLHTAGQNGVQWRDTQSALAARGYRVIVADLPGHGRSEPAAGGPVRDLAEYATWCEELIDLLDLDRPFVVGCSIGGGIALQLAARRGGRLGGAVVMAAHGGSDVPGMSVRGLGRELVDAAAPSRSDRTYFGTRAVVGRSVPAARAELIARMHRREDPQVSTSDLIGWATHDVRAALPTIACPVHLVVGDDDLWVDVRDVRSTAAAISDAQCSVLEGVGHYPMEELEDFAVLLQEWLDDLALRSIGRQREHT
ncbi:MULTISPECIES: alpha/beta fold hydrolase [Prauserella salsuginis group]|uniref:Alpha/beta fold hydrolase n=1 Tax=Prauserella salsuginis TaxID=387889 RepID=A0ABW6GBF2_9PSEU|nr:MULTISPECIES: alpha/beta hydrolase [Prauserella salsuginis group]MCR3722879.1 Pimeloyl-ACP methyl ester carboxylesterase [Prauserella flava]MCR3737446.1 Pimeloyl-ACP methyl ester carboxylesterase [Prauserella salsuginis]